MMDYFPGYLGKSGVFAAYSGLGVLPLLLRPNRSDRDGCTAGKNYLVPDQITRNVGYEALQTITNNAWQWYHTHDLSRTAAIYADILKNSVLAC
jgi:hypothetical protein